MANGLQSNLKDTSATCRDCGAGFVVTAGEQDFFKSKGFDVCVPSRCKPCTAAKKARYGDRYGAVPDATGRASTPDSGRCRNCGQDGHMAWACTAPKQAVACYHCGKQGHMSRAMSKTSPMWPDPRAKRLIGRGWPELGAAWCLL